MKIYFDSIKDKVVWTHTNMLALGIFVDMKLWKQNMLPLKLKVQGENLIFKCPRFYNLIALLHKRF